MRNLMVMLTIALTAGGAWARLAVVDYEEVIGEADVVVVGQVEAADEDQATLSVTRVLKGQVESTITIAGLGYGRRRMESAARLQKDMWACLALRRHDDRLLLYGNPLATGLAGKDDPRVALFETYVALIKIGELTDLKAAVKRQDLLAAQMRDDRWPYRKAAVIIVGGQVRDGDQNRFQPLLIEALNDTEPDVAVEALRVCAYDSWRFVGAGPAILKLVDSGGRDARVQETALCTLGILRVPEAVDVFLKYLNSNSIPLRRAAAFGLMFHTDERKIGPLLMVARQDPSGSVQAEALGGAGERAHAADR